MSQRTNKNDQKSMSKSLPFIIFKISYSDKSIKIRDINLHRPSKVRRFCQIQARQNEDRGTDKRNAENPNGKRQGNFKGILNYNI